MKEEHSLVKNTLVVGMGTFLSRISGFLREVLISSSFGVTWVTDAFLIAYTIPNLLRRLFAEGALSRRRFSQAPPRSSACRRRPWR